MARNLALLAAATNTRLGSQIGSNQVGNSSVGEKRVLISAEEWEERLSKVKLSRRCCLYSIFLFYGLFSDMNKLVMNYLSTEGYKEAAENFAIEANINSPVDLQTIDARMQVRDSIQNGDIETAVGLVNDLDPDVYRID